MTTISFVDVPHLLFSSCPSLAARIERLNDTPSTRPNTQMPLPPPPPPPLVPANNDDDDDDDDNNNNNNMNDKAYILPPSASPTAWPTPTKV